MINNKAIIILFIPTIFVVAFAIFWTVTTPKMNDSYTPPLFHQSSHKVWAHRGYVKSEHEIAENSIESYSNALSRGAKGIEIDIYFDVINKQFIVSHDKPSFDKLTLKNVITAFGNSTYYWLDFKNLQGLSQHDVNEAAQMLFELLDKANIIASTLIESPSAKNLAPLAQKGMHVSYWVFSHPDFSVLQYWKNILTIRYAMFKYSLPALSMDYRGFSPEFIELFPQTDFYLFTVNDVAAARRLGAMQEVKVILSDENFYHMSWQ